MRDTSNTPSSTDRGRRRAQSGTAALVLVVGAFAAGSDFTSKDVSIAATKRAPDVIVAGPEGVQIFSSVEKTLVRTLLEGSPADGLSGVAVAPDGSVYASRISAHQGCERDAMPELVRVNASTGKAVRVVHGASAPLVSPDGRWVAYSLQDSCASRVLGVTDLTTGRNHRVEVNASSPIPVAWSPDSETLLFRLEDLAQPGRYMRWTRVPDPQTLQPIEGLLPPFTTAAAFMPDGRLVVAGVRHAEARSVRSGTPASARSSGYRLDIVENGEVVEHLFEELRVMPGMIALRVSVDAKGRVYVLDNEGRVLVWQHGDSMARVIVQPVSDGTWVPRLRPLAEVRP